jgi:3-deoxy-D-arabino-heptulosonate 7-phosphate (DAHP) synthase class II
MEELIATGKTVMVAAGDCAEEFRIHEANIQKIYYAWRKFVVSIPF